MTELLQKSTAGAAINRKRDVLTAPMPSWVADSNRHAWSMLCEQYRRQQRELERFAASDFTDIARLVEIVYKNQFKEWNKDRSKHRYLNIVRMMSRTLAVMFQERPETYVADENGERYPEDHPQQKLWRKDAKAIKLNSWLQRMDRTTMTHRTRFGQVGWVRGKPRWFNHAPYRVAVDYDPDDPGNIEYAIGIHVRPKQAQLDESVTPDRTVSWTYNRQTETFHAYHHSGSHRYPLGTFDEEDGVNQYGFHPFTLFHSDPPEDGEVYLPARDDWWAEQRFVCRWLIALANVGDYQGFAVPVFSNYEGNEIPPVGPNMPVNLKGDQASFNFATPGSNIRDLEQMFENSLRRFAVAEGLPPNAWSVDSSVVSMAGARILRQPLEERRVERIEPMTDSINQMFEHHKGVCNYHRKNTEGAVLYEDGTQLVIKMKPVPMPSDPFQTSQSQQTRYALNLSDPVTDIMIEQRVDREEAVKLHQQHKEVNEGLSVPGPAAAHPEGVPRSPDVRRDE